MLAGPFRPTYDQGVLSAGTQATLGDMHSASRALRAVLLALCAACDVPVQPAAETEGSPNAPDVTAPTETAQVVPPTSPVCRDPNPAPGGPCLTVLDHCPPGTFPFLRLGCRSVGLPRCPEVFRLRDGTCHPRRAVCPPDTRVSPSEGCVPIDGPNGCRTIAALEALYPDGHVVPRSEDLTERIESAPAGSTLLLAPGTYRAAALIRRPLALVGVCPNQVRVEGASDGPTLDLLPGGALRVSDLTFSRTLTAVRCSGAGPVELEDVQIRETSSHAVGAGGCVALHLNRVTIRGASGSAVAVMGTPLEVTSASFEYEGHGGAIESIALGAPMLIRDTHMEAVGPAWDAAVFAGNTHPGDWATGSLTIAATSIVGPHRTGLWLSGTEVTLDHVLIRGVRNTPGGYKNVGTRALAVMSGTRPLLATLRDVAILDFTSEAIHVDGKSGETVDLERVVIDGQRLGDPREKPAGLWGDGQETLSARDVTIRDMAGSAVTIDRLGERWSFDGLLVDRVAPAPGWDQGVGIGALGGAMVTMTDAVIRGTCRSAISSHFAPSSVTVRRARLTELGRCDDAVALGVSAQVGGAVTLEDVAIEGGRVAGTWVQLASLSMRRVTIDGVGAGEVLTLDGQLASGAGDGVLLVRPAAATLEDVTITGCARAGLLATHGAGQLSGLHIEGNAFGLVFQNGADFSVDTLSVVRDNRIRDIWPDGALAVPAGPTATPR